MSEEEKQRKQKTNGYREESIIREMDNKRKE